MRTNLTGSGSSKKSINGAHAARVSVKTAESIANLADNFNIAPAFIAGSLAELGASMLADCEAVERMGRTYLDCVLEMVRRTTFKAACKVPILVSDYACSMAHQWSKDLNRPLDVVLGQLIEMGHPHYHKREAMMLVIPSYEEALFHTAAKRIREDVGDGPEIEEVLKPKVKPPHAFISFEQILASRGDAA